MLASLNFILEGLYVCRFIERNGVFLAMVEVNSFFAPFCV
jgi:hypothetical protein